MNEIMDKNWRTISNHFEGTATHWTEVVSAVNTLIQQALSTNNAEWVERIKQAKPPYNPEAPDFERMITVAIRAHFELLITTHSKENV